MIWYLFQMWQKNEIHIRNYSVIEQCILVKIRSWFHIGNNVKLAIKAFLKTQAKGTFNGLDARKNCLCRESLTKLELLSI